MNVLLIFPNMLSHFRVVQLCFQLLLSCSCLSPLSSTFYTLTENLNFPEVFGVLICSIGGKGIFRLLRLTIYKESNITIKEESFVP